MLDQKLNNEIQLIYVETGENTDRACSESGSLESGCFRILYVISYSTANRDLRIN